jgi:diaminopimelate epimerase
MLIKMNGIGNEFVVIEAFLPGTEGRARVTPEFARQLCSRSAGVGADQLLVIARASEAALSQTAIARMDIYNADGSVAEMCGNGIRCVALRLARHGLLKVGKSERIETLAGLKTVTLMAEPTETSGMIRVDMGVPRVLTPAVGEELVLSSGQRVRFHEVDMGNPHAVIFVQGLEAFPVERLGPEIERHPRFPRRTNVEFVEVRSCEELRVRVWERGAGITLACGTGACASAVVAVNLGFALQGAPVSVRLPGGELKISWGGGESSVLMEGAAEEEGPG